MFRNTHLFLDRAPESCILSFISEAFTKAQMDHSKFEIQYLIFEIQ